MKEIIIVGCIALIIVWVFTLELKNEDRWEQYASENNCYEAGYVEGSVGIGFGPVIGGNASSMIVNTYTPGKTRYLCDNNIEIYR